MPADPTPCCHHFVSISTFSNLRRARLLMCSDSAVACSFSPPSKINVKSQIRVPAFTSFLRLVQHQRAPGHRMYFPSPQKSTYAIAIYLLNVQSCLSIVLETTRPFRRASLPTHISSLCLRRAGYRNGLYRLVPRIPPCISEFVVGVLLIIDERLGSVRSSRISLRRVGTWWRAANGEPWAVVPVLDGPLGVVVGGGYCSSGSP